MSYSFQNNEEEFDPFATEEGEHTVEGEGLRFTVNKYGYIENLNKVLVPNLTKVQRRFIGKYLMLPRENRMGIISINEIERFMFHAYRLEANDIIFKTGMQVKVKLSGYIFRISERKYATTCNDVI